MKDEQPDDHQIFGEETPEPKPRRMSGPQQQIVEKANKFSLAFWGGVVGLIVGLGSMGIVMPWQSVSKTEFESQTKETAKTVKEVSDKNSDEHTDFKVTFKEIQTTMTAIVKQQDAILIELRRRHKP